MILVNILIKSLEERKLKPMTHGLEGQDANHHIKVIPNRIMVEKVWERLNIYGLFTLY